MTDRIMQSKHMKKILEIAGVYSIKIYFCSFLTFFKIFRTNLKNTLPNKKLTDFIIISIRTTHPDIYYDCILTKKPIFSIYLSLLKLSYKLYKKIKYTIIDYVLTHLKDINSDTDISMSSLTIYIDIISFYNLYET